MNDLHQLIDYVVPLYRDNQFVISARTEHVEVDYHFVREKVL